ncbi:MAG TPA: amidohydrolase family protein [Anaerolineae bacterium]|nr:amidohydrolase family protein [Anaerolineae bacterium]
MTTITLPGLIDVHTHLRVPGGEHKEDFATGTAAALAGGLTQILGMPNTSPPLSTPDALQQANATASATIRCDVGLFAGASAEDIHHLPDLAPHAVALKIYLNDTFGKLRVDKVSTLRACFENWPRHKLIAMHAEKQSVAVGIGLAATYQRHVHFCHISRRQEIELIADAKAAGLPVTCEVTPHHLFMDESDFARMGTRADMRPVLGSPDDVAALWEHLLTTVDCIATDHAPHTIAEKESDPPPPGISGLETSLGLMLTAVHDNKLTLDQLQDLMHTNPQRIFNLPTQPDTYITIDPDAHTTIDNDKLFTKCGWTPFHGRTVHGRLLTVTLRGQTAFDNGQLLAQPGTGQLIKPTS